MFLFYTFKVIPGRIDFVLSLVLHLLLSSLVNELCLARLPEVLADPFPAAKVLQRYTLFPFPSKFLNNFFSKIFQARQKAAIPLHLTCKVFLQRFFVTTDRCRGDSTPPYSRVMRN